MVDENQDPKIFVNIKNVENWSWRKAVWVSERARPLRAWTRLSMDCVTRLARMGSDFPFIYS